MNGHSNNNLNNRVVRHGRYIPMHETLQIDSPIFDWIDNWSDGVVVAGGLVHNILMKDRKYEKESDLDIFLICPTQSEATPASILPRIKKLMFSAFQRFKKTHSSLPMRVEYINGILEFSNIHDYLLDVDYPHNVHKEDSMEGEGKLLREELDCTDVGRDVQIIVQRVFSSVDSLLHRFDLPPCQVALVAPNKPYATLAARYYLATGEILVSSKVTIKPHRREKYSREYSRFCDIDPFIHPIPTIMHCRDEEEQKSEDDAIRIEKEQLHLDKPTTTNSNIVNDVDVLNGPKRGLKRIYEDVVNNSVDNSLPTDNKRCCQEFIDDEDATVITNPCISLIATSSSTPSETKILPVKSQFIRADTWSDLEAWLDSVILSIDRISYSSHPEYCIHGRQDVEYLGGNVSPCHCHIIPSRLSDLGVWPKDLLPAHHVVNSTAMRGSMVNVVNWTQNTSWDSHDEQECFLHRCVACVVCLSRSFIRNCSSATIINNISSSADEYNKHNRFGRIQSTAESGIHNKNEVWICKLSLRGGIYQDGHISVATVGARICSQTTCPLLPDCILFTDTDNHAIRCLHLRTRMITTLYSRCNNTAESSGFKFPYDIQWVDEKLCFVILAKNSSDFYSLWHCDMEGTLYRTPIPQKRILSKAITGLHVSSSPDRSNYSLHPKGINRNSWIHLVGSLNMVYYPTKIDDTQDDGIGNKVWMCSNHVMWSPCEGLGTNNNSHLVIDDDTPTNTPNGNLPGCVMIHCSNGTTLVSVDTAIYRTVPLIKFDNGSDQIDMNKYLKREWSVISKCSTFTTGIREACDISLVSSLNNPANIAIKCHRDVLRKKWPYFVRLEDSGMSETNTGIVDFGERFSWMALKAICWLIYVGDVRAYTSLDPSIRRELDENALEFDLKLLGVVGIIPDQKEVEVALEERPV